MKKSFAISLNIILLAYVVSFADPNGQEHFYGKWRYKEDKKDEYITISANSIGSAPILRWESERNFDSESNVSYPNGYQIWWETKSGRPISSILWRHSISDDRILLQYHDGNGYFGSLSDAFKYEGYVLFLYRVEIGDE